MEEEVVEEEGRKEVFTVLSWPAPRIDSRDNISPEIQGNIFPPSPAYQGNTICINHTKMGRMGCTRNELIVNLTKKAPELSGVILPSPINICPLASTWLIVEDRKRQ